jgi:hypothetical protein
VLKFKSCQPFSHFHRKKVVIIFEKNEKLKKKWKRFAALQNLVHTVHNTDHNSLTANNRELAPLVLASQG